MHGHIQLQSEGAETWFRSITVEPIRSLPKLVSRALPILPLHPAVDPDRPTPPAIPAPHARRGQRVATMARVTLPISRIRAGMRWRVLAISTATA